MDIYLIREGQETGPFSEQTVRTLLSQGDATMTDLAWQPGEAEWRPLGELLPADSSALLETKKAAAAEEDRPVEPPTPKQKAFLAYLGTPIPAHSTKDQAALLLNDAMEDPALADRVTRWNEERHRLHPDLFAADIQARKENRATHFFEICQTAGAEYFTGVSKAHCQVLVGFLDVKFPNWDARPSDAAELYFFPAVAEKFPQLVNKQWRGRLHYSERPNVSSDTARQPRTSKLKRTGVSPLIAIARGIVLGLFILGILFLGYRTLQTDSVAAATGSLPPSGSENSLAEPSLEIANVAEIAALPSIPAPEAVLPAEVAPPAPSIEPAPQAVASELIPEAPLAVIPDATTPAPPMVMVPETAVAPPTPAMAMPPDPAPAADPAMAPMAATPTVPLPPTAVETAPMAGLPGMEPSAPVAPPSATLPMAPVLPTLPPEAAMVPPLPTPEPAPEAPAATSEKSRLQLTKFVEAELAYGKIMLPPGTPVTLVSRRGSFLQVSYQNRVISVPATSTNFEE